MFCPDCGAFVKDGTQFCTHCGATIEAHASEPILIPQEPEPAPAAPVAEKSASITRQQSAAAPAYNETYVPVQQQTAAAPATPYVPVQQQTAAAPATPAPAPVQQPPAAPVPTAAPVQQPPAAPVPTAAPVHPPVAPPAPVPAAPAPAKKKLTWLWILLALLVVGGIVAAVLFFSGNDSSDDRETDTTKAASSKKNDKEDKENKDDETDDTTAAPDIVTNEIVTNPTAGTAYKLGMDQGDGTILYFNGKTESSSVTYRLATTTDADEAVDVYLETAYGGYRLYFMDGTTKIYIRVYHRIDGEPGQGKGSLEFVTEAPSEVFTYDIDANTLFYDYDGNNAYYMGSYNTYTSISVSNISYIIDDNASTIGVSQFPARFYTSTNP